MHLNMFGLLAALNSFMPKERQGREALIYDNDIREGHGLPKHRIYRESSADKKARKELIGIRTKERIQEQMKFVRLMKKLVLQIEQSGDIDEDFEQMRRKVGQIEMKIEKTARENGINSDEMFDLNQPDDEYDIQLEQLVQRVVFNETDNIDSTKKCNDSKHARGDYGDILPSSSILNNISHHSGDAFLIDCMRNSKLN